MISRLFSILKFRRISSFKTFRKANVTTFSMKKMNILVTGGAGYVGSVLVPSLMKEGYFITCLDRFFFGNEFLSSKLSDGNLELIRDDIRWFDPKILENMDLVMDLAALSNDPVGELNPEKTFEINHKGRLRVARLCKKYGVPRYILASSASIYGQQKNIATEDSEVHPLTAYSKANRMAEIDVLKLNDNDFKVTVLRFSSLYGLSPRMRFDLAVNSIVLDIFNTGKIFVHGKNNQRPFLHIKDAVRAYSALISTKPEKIAGEIFNVGSNEENYIILDLAKEVGDAILKNYDMEAKDTPDNRSYIASSDKIKQRIGFEAKHTVKEGSKEIYSALKSKELIFDKKMITLEWYKHILSNKELSDKFAIDGKIL